jgi:hypothetical protein
MPIIRYKNSVTTTTVPANGSLQNGELAINITDRKMWIGNASLNPVKIMGTIANQAANSVSITGGTITGVTVGATTKSAATTSSLTVGGTSITSFDTTNTLASNSNSIIPTSDAVKTYIDTFSLGRLRSISSFTTAGTANWTKTSLDINKVHVICVGGGGGARAYSECGGAGGYAEGVYDVSGLALNATVLVTVGAGGAGGVYFGFSGAGATTSFGLYISATGGSGSSNPDQHTGGLGGIGQGGQINGYGGKGGSHNNMDQYSPSNASGGIGGISFFGGCLQGDRPDWSTSSTTAASGTGGVAIPPGHNAQGGRSGQVGACIVYAYT